MAARRHARRRLCGSCAADRIGHSQKTGWPRGGLVRAGTATPAAARPRPQRIRSPPPHRRPASRRRKTPPRHRQGRLFRISRRNPPAGRSARREAPPQPDGAVTWFEFFLILFPLRDSEGTTTMTAANKSRRARILLAALVLLLGAYWAGARFGARQPTNVEALPLGGSNAPADVSQRDATLTNDESINVRIYRQASPAVANILTKATEYDFFMDPVPVEGAGSGFVIDSRGYILTNYHVVE